MDQWIGHRAGAELLRGRAARARCPRDSRRDVGATTLDSPWDTQFPQTLGRRIQGFVALAEGKPYLLRSVSWLLIETRSGHDRDTNLFDQILRKLHIVFEAKGADIGHQVIRAPRPEASEANLVQHRDET